MLSVTAFADSVGFEPTVESYPPYVTFREWCNNPLCQLSIAGSGVAFCQHIVYRVFLDKISGR